MKEVTERLNRNGTGDMKEKAVNNEHYWSYKMGDKQEMKAEGGYVEWSGGKKA